MPVRTSLLLLSVACGQQKATQAPATPAEGTGPAEPEVAAPAIPLAGPILASADGMGAVKLCTTLGDLRPLLTEGRKIEPIGAWQGDWQAVAVTVEGEQLMLIPFPASESIADDSRITWLYTENNRVRTDVGVGPGTPLTFSVTEYGLPTLFYERDGPEYVRFAQGPTELAFRVRAPGDEPRAGIYTPSRGSLHAAGRFLPGARIGAIEVSIVCPEPTAGGAEEVEAQAADAPATP